jgi:hypothetical protein
LIDKLNLLKSDSDHKIIYDEFLKLLTEDSITKDRRKKEYNQAIFDKEHGWAVFTRTDLDDNEKRYAGVIAQEVLAVLPEVVTEDAEGRYSVAYGNLAALLIEAIKELKGELNEAKLEIEKLKNK